MVADVKLTVRYTKLFNTTILRSQCNVKRFHYKRKKKKKKFFESQCEKSTIPSLN